MKLPGMILLAAIGSILLYGVGVEVALAPSAVKAAPGATLVSFGELAAASFPDQAKPGEYLKRVPGSIRKLENQRVTIQGFMIPTQTADRKVSEFLLVRSQASCCFGMPPGVSDVLAIHMAGKPADPLMDRPVNVTGQLHVQEQWAGTSLSSLYQMEAECVASGSSLPPLKQVRSPQSMGLE